MHRFAHLAHVLLLEIDREADELLTVALEFLQHLAMQR